MNGHNSKFQLDSVDSFASEGKYSVCIHVHLDSYNGIKGILKVSTS